MSPLTFPDREPFFLTSNGRRLFAVYHPPQTLRNGAGAVFFAPFGEEMNRARRMATLLAETLAAAGVGTLIFDNSCTGDSQGRFAEASWNAWVEDGVAAIGWLAERTNGPVAPIGLRLGGALALQSAGHAPCPVDHAILWQPVTAGQIMMTQFMRIRVATALSGTMERATTASLRQRLDAGETLEIGGYDISPALARAIEGIKLVRCIPSATTNIHWLEVAAEASDDLMPPSRPVIAAWRDAGVRVSASTVAGEQFWSTQETATAPALIEATVRALARIAA